MICIINPFNLNSYPSLKKQDNTQGHKTLNCLFVCNVQVFAFLSLKKSNFIIIDYF